MTAETEETLVPPNITERENILLHAILKYENAIDMMFDGPDDSDEAYAKARWREGKTLLRRFLETPHPKPVINNVYHPHPLMINSGTFWRCDHGTTGYDGDMNFIGCANCKAALGEPA